MARDPSSRDGGTAPIKFFDEPGYENQGRPVDIMAYDILKAVFICYREEGTFVKKSEFGDAFDGAIRSLNRRQRIPSSLGERLGQRHRIPNRRRGNRRGRVEILENSTLQRQTVAIAVVGVQGAQIELWIDPKSTR